MPITRGMSSPETIVIHPVENGEARVCLRQDVVQKADDEEHLERTYFEWSEVEIRLVDRDNLLGYVQENFDELFAYGLAEENKPKPKTAKELRDEQIKALKDDALVQSAMLIEMFEMIVGSEV